MGLFTKSPMTEELVKDNNLPITEPLPNETDSKHVTDPDELFNYALDFISMPEHNWLSNIMRKTMTKEQFFNLIRRELKNETKDEELIDKTCKSLETYIWGYYIIEPLLNDDSISDIRIIDENRIRIKRNGKRSQAVYPDGEKAGQPIRFIDANDYLRFVSIICSRNKISLADTNAVQTFTDAENNPNARMRFDLTSALINSNGKPCVQIRKIPKRKKSFAELVQLDVMPQEVADYMKEKIRTATGILFTGKGASGKSTVMNASLDVIPYDKSALVLEENNELFSNHPDMMFQHIITSRDEGHVQYSLKDLATNGLLLDLDYFIIGEIKGEEAAYFMNASYTGHQCWASVHGMNSQEAIRKLADYVTQGTRYSLRDAFNMLRFMEVIVFMKDFKVEEISEVRGVDPDTGEIQYELVYKRGEFMNLNMEDKENE